MAARKIFFFLSVLVFLPFTPFLAGAEEKSVSINFWPLFHYTSLEGVSEIEGLGPFFHWKKDSHRRQWGIRPFFYWTGDEHEDLWRLEYLYPFGKYQVRGSDKKGYLFPLSVYRDQEFDGRRKWNFEFFPFFIGETEKGADYFGIFPLFGALLERYGKEEIRFFLWPLYSKTLSDGNQTTNLVWPFLSFTEGETKRGYRFWPIYGQKEEFGVSQSEFFLWPIFQQRTQRLDTDDPMYEKLIFPFYSSKESKDFEGKIYLWPFFSYSINRAAGFEQFDLPWPFFRSIKGEHLHGIRIFIFYSDKVKDGESKRTSILYPFFSVEEDRTEDIQTKTHRIFLSRMETREDPQGIRKERSVRIWPLFDNDREETGRETFNLFYLLPIKDEGLERNLFPLFRIFRREEDPKKGISINLLWGFYKRVKREDMESWEIAHLVGMKREQGVKTVSFFKGLLRYQSDEKKANLRFFYLPFHLRWSLPHPIYLSLGTGDRALRSLSDSHFSKKAGINEAATGEALVTQEGESDLKSVRKELTDGRQEDWHIGDGLISSPKDSFKF